MAAVSAAWKRSYDDMTGVAPNSQTSGCNGTSQVHSPLGTPPHAFSGHLDLVNAENSRAPGALLRRTTFESAASVVLIGVHGVGKSSLGVLAATAYNRHLIDTERVFLEATGSSATAYRKHRGTAEYQRRHNKVLEDALKSNSTGAVIVCSFSDLEGNGASLLAEYSQTHPVIHITRDADGIQSSLRVWTTERVKELLSTSSSLLRSCCNYEFFNLTENEHGAKEGQVFDRSNYLSRGSSAFNGSFLTLKRVERDFIRSLRNIIGDHNRGPAHHSAYPFSQVAIERRTYTFAVTIRVSDVIAKTVDFDEAQIGADCIELMVDSDDPQHKQSFNDLSLAFAIVRRATILPILLTTASNTLSQLPRITQREMVDFCFRLGPELCAVNLSFVDSDVSRLVKCKGRSRVIGVLELDKPLANGWHDESCLDIYRRGARLGCDLVKITMPARSVEDGFAVEALQHAVGSLGLPPRLIAFNTGCKGRLSKCLNRTLTSVAPTRLSPQVDEDATVTAKNLTQALFATFIFDPMRFYIYGADVSYSLSPAMHNAAYEACGMRYKYEAYSSKSFDDFNKIVRAADFGGIAITQPYKTIAVSMMDGLSQHAKAIGAVNTIVPVRELASDGAIPSELAIIAQRNQQGPVKALYGFNTDWVGIRACIRKGMSPANTIRAQSSGLVCGAGGMARSAIYALVSLGVRNIFICNRTSSKATALAKHYNDLIDSGAISELVSQSITQTRVRVLDSFTSAWPKDVRQPAVIVSCIPRQAAGEPPTNFALPEEWLKSVTGGVVLEVAYRQPQSPLTHQIRERAQTGWNFMDGFDVLPEQAFSQFELFTGRRAPRELMRSEIVKHSPADEAF